MAPDMETMPRLDAIVTVVDALRMRDEFGSGLSLTRKNIDEEDIENLVIQQIEFCNIVLLNKAAEVSPDELGRIREIIRTLQPRAEIIDTNYGDVDLDKIINTGMFDFDEVATSATWIQEVESHEAHESHETHEAHESNRPQKPQTPQEQLAAIVEKWHSLLPNAEILPISAKNKFGTNLLLKRIEELLPESPAFFDKDQLTDKPARFFVSEIIREKILLYYDKEIPYSVEVVVESFKEDDRQIRINAVIYVERDSQKGIIIGHQGVALKKVSTEARKALEKFFDKHIYLEIFVKVDKDWRSSQKELDNFGYNPE
jgi:hypothetical protein